jgi:hypothetical protein
VNARENGDIDNLFVMGCLSERYKKDLQKEMQKLQLLSLQFLPLLPPGGVQAF